MSKALREAYKAFEKDEVPIGAVVVSSEGDIIARAYNQVEWKHTQRAHAESLTIEKAGTKIGDWRLNGYWLYVTLEPCLMCMSLIQLSRLAGVVYAAASPLFGFRLDKFEDLRVYKKGVPEIIDGVGEQESSALLKKFFQLKRKQKGG